MSQLETLPATSPPTLRGDEHVDIPPQLVGMAGPAAMLVGLFWMLARDHLVTGPAHRRELDAKDQQIADIKASCDQRVADKDAQVVMWRAVAETKDAQGTELLEHSRLSVQLLQAIERRAQEQAARQTEA